MLKMKDYDQKFSATGDLAEFYNYISIEAGRTKANIWYLSQIFSSVLPYLKFSILGRCAMFKSYLLTGFRNITKEKLLSTISIAGLSIGLASALLILTYVHYENSFDNFHKDVGNIYRIYTLEKNAANMNEKVALTMGPISPALEELPGITAATKLFRLNSWVNLKVNNKSYKDLMIYSADSSFFDVFSFERINGFGKDVLSSPQGAIVTHETAIKIFGTEDVLGKSISSEDYQYTITAVVKNIPKNSHLQFDILLSEYSFDYFDTLLKGNEFYSYMKLAKDVIHEDILDKAKIICDKIYKPLEEYGYKATVGFQKLIDIHLNSNEFRYQVSQNGNLNTINALVALAIALVLIASLNFLNLLTARSQKRFKEIALRKVVGADRKSIVMQFISEATLIALISSAISFFLYFLVIRKFSQLINRDLSGYQSEVFFVALACLILAVVIGFLAAIYPAFSLSGKNTTLLLKSFSTGRQKNRLLAFTVFFQFTVVTILIASVLVIYNQVQFMKNKDLGFNKDEIITVKMNSYDKYQNLKSELQPYQAIKNITASQSIPGNVRSGQSIHSFAGVELEGKPGINENRIQDGFLETYGIRLIAGRDFNENLVTDTDCIIINEAAARAVGYLPEDAVGKIMKYSPGSKKVIGVIENYNFASLHNRIEPLILSRYMNSIRYISLQVSMQDITNTLSHIKQIIQKHDPENIFEYSFLDTRLQLLYEGETRNNTLVFCASLITVALSIMGLFALTAFTIVGRTKEIGVRKVLGASVLSINLNLLKDISKWVLIACLVACPVAWYFTNAWLGNFAYRLNLNIWYFITAGLSTLIISLLTVIYLTTRAANANPVESIRNE
jgi:putative ABC transport system permease protein